MTELVNSDRLLAGRMLRGDEEAFAAFMDAHMGPLFRFAMRRTDGDADAAEEIVQMTLCAAVRKLGTFRGEASLLTWLGASTAPRVPARCTAADCQGGSERRHDVRAHGK